jgi:hypothetical protein
VAKKRKVKVIESGPLYPRGGEDIQVQWFYLPDQKEDEQPLGCRCVHKKSGSKRRSEESHLSRRANLARALKKLLTGKKWTKYARKQKKGTWSGKGCEVCEGQLVAGTRVSEDWFVSVCTDCGRKVWESTYKPPRRPPPFKLE